MTSARRARPIERWPSLKAVAKGELVKEVAKTWQEER
jgi:hypothetical protein